MATIQKYPLYQSATPLYGCNVTTTWNKGTVGQAAYDNWTFADNGGYINYNGDLKTYIDFVDESGVMHQGAYQRYKVQEFDKTQLVDKTSNWKDAINGYDGTNYDHTYTFPEAGELIRWWSDIDEIRQSDWSVRQAKIIVTIYDSAGAEIKSWTGAYNANALTNWSMQLLNNNDTTTYTDVKQLRLQVFVTSTSTAKTAYNGWDLKQFSAWLIVKDR